MAIIAIADQNVAESMELELLDEAAETIIDGKI